MDALRRDTVVEEQPADYIIFPEQTREVLGKKLKKKWFHGARKEDGGWWREVGFVMLWRSVWEHGCCPHSIMSLTRAALMDAGRLKPPPGPPCPLLPIKPVLPLHPQWSCAISFQTWRSTVLGVSLCPMKLSVLGCLCSLLTITVARDSLATVHTVSPQPSF